ncbi:MAG: hypothetical protein VX910_08925 [Candidatus Latescibacterota bacterium]|nr:hypothetical protein [Candidatus Latescibacterota bacterium]
MFAVDYETRRAAGLSNNKVLPVLDLANKPNEGIVPGRRVLNWMDDESIIEQLTQVRWIGRWTDDRSKRPELGDIPVSINPGILLRGDGRERWG